MLTRGSVSCILVSVTTMISKGCDKTRRRFQSSSICLPSEEMFICNVENIFGDNLHSRNSAGVKYLNDIVSLIKSSVSTFSPGISSRRDWIVKLRVEFIFPFQEITHYCQHRKKVSRSNIFHF